MTTLPQYYVSSGELHALLLALGLPGKDKLTEICRRERGDIDQTVETDYFSVARVGETEGFSALLLYHMTGMGMDEISIHPGDADPQALLADAVREHAEVCRSAGEDDPNALEAWAVTSAHE